MENTPSHEAKEQDLYEQLCSLENLELAFEQARKGKSSKPYVIEFAKELTKNLAQLRNHRTDHFTQFQSHAQKTFSPEPSSRKPLNIIAQRIFTI